MVGTNSGIITNSYATGEVTTNGSISGAGGLVGINYGEIRDSYATGGVSSTGSTIDYVGGLVGTHAGRITNAYATGNVTGIDNVGGLVGANQSGGTIENTYAAGLVTGTGNNVGGLVGANDGGTVNGSYYDRQTTGKSDENNQWGTPKTTVEMMKQATFDGWDFGSIGVIQEDITYPYFGWQPSVNSAATNEAGKVITITFSKAMANPYGKHDQFSVTVGEAVYGFSSASLSTDATKINLTLEDGVFIKYNQEVTVSYKAGDVTAADGSLLSSFTNYPVDNNTRNRPSGGGGGGGAATLVIGKVNPPDVTMGNTYTHTFTAGGGSKPYTFAVTDGALPEGLSLAENGTLSGTPAAAGTYNYTVTVTDHAGRTSSHAFTQVIKDGSGSAPAKWRVIILTVDSLEVTVDGRPYTLDAAPYVKPGVDRALVPIRFVSEAMGAQVDWIAADRQVFIKDAGKEIVLTIGSKDVLIDGKKHIIDCPAEVVPPGRVFVPLRFVSETLGARVDYENSTGKITITW